MNGLRALDLAAVRQHVAAYQAAWAEDSDASETRKTVTALLCAQDLVVLLDYLDAEVS